MRAVVCADPIDISDGGPVEQVCDANGGMVVMRTMASSGPWIVGGRALHRHLVPRCARRRAAC